MDDILERQRRIKKSRILEAFTPSCPIDATLFCGRTDETNSIVNGLSTPGRHVVLYGDRGVGKTSLANYVATIMRKSGVRVERIGCSPSDSFESIAVKILNKFGIKYDETIISKTGGGIGLGNVLSGRKEKEVQKRQICDIDNPTWLASKIVDEEIKGVLIIDEFDTIPDVSEKEKFSQLIKYLSDNNSQLHILLVGISRSVSELMGGHASIDRSLTQVWLKRMSDLELLDIIKKGEDRTELQFEEEVAQKIVSMSHGFPYFTHSLALEASTIAVCDERKVVTMDDYNEGLEKALENIEASLKQKYDKAIGVQKTQNMKRIVYSAAVIGSNADFSMKEWTESYKELYGEKSQQSLSGSMAYKIGNDPDKIISKVSRGIYTFNDSRMPCYILLLGKPD